MHVIIFPMTPVRDKKAHYISQHNEVDSIYCDNFFNLAQ